MLPYITEAPCSEVEALTNALCAVWHLQCKYHKRVLEISAYA